MQTVMWNRRRIIIIIVISIVAYFLLRKKEYTYKDEFVLKNVRAETVWEFLADFSNNKKHLIPHMDSFSIVSESGNYDNWKYSVTFDETYHFWPYLKSRTVGHYSIKANGDKYLISSVHDVCFMRGLLCSKSYCDFHLSPSGKEDTLYREDIIYECPPLFSGFCEDVAEKTRKSFIERLKVYFKQH